MKGNRFGRTGTVGWSTKRALFQPAICPKSTSITRLYRFWKHTTTHPKQEFWRFDFKVSFSVGWHFHSLPGSQSSVAEAHKGHAVNHVRRSNARRGEFIAHSYIFWSRRFCWLKRNSMGKDVQEWPFPLVLRWCGKLYNITRTPIMPTTKGFWARRASGWEVLTCNAPW